MDKENRVIMGGQSSTQLLKAQKKLAGGFMIRRASQAQIGEENVRSKSNLSFVEGIKEDVM